MTDPSNGRTMPSSMSNLTPGERLAMIQNNEFGVSIGHYVALPSEEIGDWENGEVRLRAIYEPPAHLRNPLGGVLTGALLTMVDNISGFTAGLSSLPDGWVVTTNMMVEHVRPAATGRLQIDSAVLRQGKHAAITSAQVIDLDDNGACVAEAVLTSAVLIPEGGPPTWSRPARMTRPPASDEPFLPLREWLGVRSTPAGIELDARDALRNPWGVMHGGVTAALVDATAEAAAADRFGEPATVTSAVIHYLAPARVGPFLGQATIVGRIGAGVALRVDIVDRGYEDRVVATATLTADPSASI
jgi:uncharacterized protein (TIGR00369 family)